MTTSNAIAAMRPLPPSASERVAPAPAMARKSLVALMKEVSLAGRGDGQIAHGEVTSSVGSEAIPGRETFVAILKRQIAIRNRHGTPASILYFRLNAGSAEQIAGHSTEAASHRAAQILRARVRGSDVVARLSDSELAVMLTHATFEQAQKKAQALVDILRNVLVSDSILGVTADCIELAAALDRKQP